VHSGCSCLGFLEQPQSLPRAFSFQTFINVKIVLSIRITI
jgi:hypothetical protein